MFRCKMLGSELFTLAATQICDRNIEKWIYEKVLKVFGTPRCPIAIDPFVVRDLPDAHHDCFVNNAKV